MPFVSKADTETAKIWYKGNKTWSCEQQKKYGLMSHHLHATMSPTSGEAKVWRIPNGAFSAPCLLPTNKLGGGSTMIGEPSHGSN